MERQASSVHWRLLVICAFCLACLSPLCSAATAITTTTFTVPAGYDRYVHPYYDGTTDGSSTTLVEVNVYFNSLLDISDVDQTADLDLYIDYIWTDDRLAWDPSVRMTSRCVI